MRNVFASLLLLGALLAGLTGAIMNWIDHTVRSPEPTAQLAQSIITDKAVLAAVSEQLGEAINARLPETAKQIPALQERLPALLKKGVEEAISNDKAHTAWRSVLDETRRSTITELTSYSAHPSGEVPSVWIRLDPLVSLLWANVEQTADPATQTLLSRVEMPQDVRIKAFDLTPEQAELAGRTLNSVGNWGLAYGLAFVLLVLGIALGTGVARWVMLTVFAGLGIVAVLILRGLIGAATFTYPGSQLVSAVGTRAVRQLGDSLAAWLGTFLYMSCGLAAVGMVCAIAVGIRNRRSSPGGQL